MMPANLLTYSIQLALVIGVAAFIPLAIGLNVPRAKLLYWQFVLLASLLLPIFRAWKQELVTDAVTITTGVFIPVRNAPAVMPQIPLTELVMGLLAAGIVARGCWLCIGLWRLHRYRVNSRPLVPPSSWGAEVDLRISDDIASPVTFGFVNPVILLPAGFASLDEPMREAILCHEVLHVRRRDWLFTMAEELVRAVLWFHPAVWWLLGQIQLTREQTVDEEVIDITNARGHYVDALLAIAGTAPQPDLAPAPLFLRKRHLKQRVISILKEVHMSETRTVFAFAASVLMLAASCWFVTGALPLQAAPQTVADAPGVSVDMNGAQLMHRGSVAYPRDAAVKGIQGTVVVQVKLDSGGNVADAAILSGPDELRKPVLESVLNWHFAHDYASSTRQVSVAFEPPRRVEVPPTAAMRSGVLGGIIGAVPSRAVMTGEPVMLKQIIVNGLSEQDRNQLIASLPVREGQMINPRELSGVMQAIHNFDEHLQFGARSSTNNEMVLTISTPGFSGISMPPPPPPTQLSAMQSGDPNSRPIRVGGNVSAANIVSQVKPVYPPLAKAAGVQGKVSFDATIGTDGHVQNLQLVSGPPLLVQAAMEAVQQWVYKPTLLNGNPVQVITTIDVNFTLSQ